MQRRTITALFMGLCLNLTAIAVALAQPASPLVGIPHMSNEAGGPEVQQFPAGTDTIYLVFDYEAKGPTEVVAEIRSEEQQGSVIFTSRETYDGSGTANIEIPGPGSSAFPDGVYDTIIRFGDQHYITAGWEWVVGDVQLPPEDTSGSQAPISPLQQNEPDSQPAVETGSAPVQSQSVQSAAPAQTTPGLSPIILVGLGVIVLVLLAVIAWAVRGFMTAA